MSPLKGSRTSAITLAPVILYRDELPEALETHEAIHIRQQIECGLSVGTLFSILLGILLWATGSAWGQILAGTLCSWILGFFPFLGWFYILYGCMFLAGMVRTSKAFLHLTRAQIAYLSIPFEQEAFNHQEEGFAYLDRRTPFAWLQYLSGFFR